MDAICLERVRLRFGDLAGVDGISLEAASGEIVGLLGHNGAGKTTLLRIINGLLRPDEGVVRVLGRDPAREGPAVRTATGVLTEYPALDEYLSPYENLAIYAALNDVPPSEADRRIEALLVALHLSHKRSEPARDLSAGLKQRVALARAMVHEPEVLLLDEPTTNLDPVATRAVRDLIVEASRSRGRTVLLSTHDLAEAEELCDRIGIVRHGRLLSFGTPAELRRGLGGARGVRVTTASGQAELAQQLLDGRLDSERRRHDMLEITGELEIPWVVSLLVGEGIDIHRVEPLEPSLEDLYLRLHAPLPTPTAAR